MRFTLYPIYWLSDGLDDEQFDLNRLPFDVTENVRIEEVSQRFRPDAFDLGRERLGTEILRELQRVQYALVHRYDPEPLIDEKTHAILGYKQSNERSEKLIRQVAACHRLIRPMRQSALLSQANFCATRGLRPSFSIFCFNASSNYTMRGSMVFSAVSFSPENNFAIGVLKTTS